MPPRERNVVGCLALLYLLGAAAVALLLPSQRDLELPVIAGLTLLYAVVGRVSFEIGSTESVATQLVLVPMLLLLPLGIVPLVVPVAHLLSRLPDYARGRKPLDRVLYDVADSWLTIPPVLVLAAGAPGPPALTSSGVYLAAFAAQVIGDFVPVMARERLVNGLCLRDGLRMAFWVYRIDAILSPVGLMIAIAAKESPWAVTAAVPLVGLLHLFARERHERHTAALELNRAYRGTVMLLSDVVEADDHYTADHCRSVVSLVSAVADELDIDPESRQELEFAALLHDVGKIVIPNEILNKPGALTDEEYELMKTHTIEGQVLLDRVGGLLGRVGRIVRSCHERWDGGGYPDGLAGYDIPLEARIVFACDAYNAMTTDRPYRAAMSQETALEELWANAGTQFDPRVVAALARVVRSGAAIEPSPAREVRELLSGDQPLAVTRSDASAL